MSHGSAPPLAHFALALELERASARRALEAAQRRARALARRARERFNQLTPEQRWWFYSASAFASTALLALVAAILLARPASSSLFVRHDDVVVVVAAAAEPREMPLARAPPTQPCRALAPPYDGVAETAGALAYYAHALGARALAAAHIGDARCVACVVRRNTIDDGALELDVLVNPVLVAESSELAPSLEHDVLCARPARFMRARHVVVRYVDAVNGEARERRYEGARAAAVQHVLDLLAGRRVCAT